MSVTLSISGCRPSWDASFSIFIIFEAFNFSSINSLLATFLLVPKTLLCAAVVLDFFWTFLRFVRLSFVSLPVSSFASSFSFTAVVTF